jgi:leader peptidase (prepilin peptidase) / N-methyltransferase
VFILDLCVMRIYWTIFAGLLGLAFGSFLNVCLSRWPEGESVVKPRSRCRACGRTLTWWENVPVVSWLALRGRCRTCGAWIGVRYVVVELAVGTLWAAIAWKIGDRHLGLSDPAVFSMMQNEISKDFFKGLYDAYRLYSLVAGDLSVEIIGQMLFCWWMVGLAALDIEHLWLPDKITLPGIAAGYVFTIGRFELLKLRELLDDRAAPVGHMALHRLVDILIAAAFVLLIRWLYWLVRRKEGLGLGDAKLMAMLAAWFGLSGALLAFFIGVVLGAMLAVTMLVMPKRDGEAWSARKLPLGAFLCTGGIVCSLWGQQLLFAYLRWARF